MTLAEFFRAHTRAALAFSGGADSAFLLRAAREYGCDVTAYYGKTAFQPEFEYRDALRLTRDYAQSGIISQIGEAVSKKS